MTTSQRAVYVVHDRTTSAQPGILSTAFESINKAISHLDGFRAQHPDAPGPLSWTTGPGWADGCDAQGSTVFYVFGLALVSGTEVTYFERSARGS